MAGTQRYARPAARPAVAHKDPLNTAGIRTTFGSPMYKDNVPTTDALIVKRVRAAAAALRCGMVPIATGSDTGGSLGNPAAFNNRPFRYGAARTIRPKSRSACSSVAPWWNAHAWIRRSVAGTVTPALRQ